MNAEPPTGDELNRMLVTMKRNVVTRVAEMPRSRRSRRSFGWIIGLVALVGITSAGGAVALGLGLVPNPLVAIEPSSPGAPAAPDVSPTPTPTKTAPVVRPEDATPASTIRFDCDELGSAAGVSRIVPDPDGFESGIYNPHAAALLQSGVLSCLWSSGEGGALLTADVSSDTTGARSWIDSRLADGERPFGVGEASSSGCGTTLVSGCVASILAGGYWVEIEYQEFHGGANTDPAVIDGVARDMISALSDRSPLPRWEAPIDSWSSVTDCSPLTTANAMSDLLATPGVTGPRATLPGSSNGIQQLAPSISCRWSIPDSQQLPDGQIRSLTVQLSAGSAWAVDERPIEGTEVSVAGASTAIWVCQIAEGESCWLDVVSGDSWLEFGAGDGLVGSDQAAVVRAAAAVLATHPE